MEKFGIENIGILRDFIKYATEEETEKAIENLSEEELKFALRLCIYDIIRNNK